MAETEYTTVLFTDVVGSTELHSNMSPEAGDELRRNHFRALRQAIASSGGKEVKNLGDGLMVVFPAASRALDCAIAMQQSVHRGNSNLNRSLELRVGISAGEAAIEDGDYFGDPVVEAARLCARARGGQILVADLVRASAGRRSSHSFSVIGRVYLKGLTDPVDTLELAWEPLDEDVPRSDEVPFPAPLAHRPRVGVIGRETELAALHAAAKRVASGEGREVLLLAGEPGQGKTTLVSEAARRCHEAGMTVLFGRCDEEVSAPYRPFHEALNHYVKYADERSLRSHVAALGGELARLAPALQHRLGSSPPALTNDGETERYLLYAAVTALLESAGAVHGVVLVLDDLHWADKPSLQLLRHVVANSSGFRLLILGTYRDSELSSAHPLNDVLAAFHREPYGFSIIGLKGLNDADVIAYMEAAAGHHLDDDAIGLAQDLYRETDGNPFFVGEVLRHLYESGVIVQDASGRWFATEAPGRQALPHSIRAVIGTRVSRLGERAMLVLSAASVIGRDFDIDLLTEAISVEDEGEELIDLLDKAQRAALVREIPHRPGHYSFAHALIQHTLYEDIGGARRARLHRSIGEGLERLYPNAGATRVGELARHFLLATRPTDNDKAINYARRAGEAALDGLAPDDAVRYFTQALDLIDQGSDVDVGLRIDVLIGLGKAQRLAGISEFRTTFLVAARAAKDSADTERLVEAALSNSRGFFSSAGRIDDERVEVLTSALDAMPDTDSAKRARLLSRLCNELAFGPLDRRLALANESKAIARRLGDPSIFIEVVSDCSVSLRIPSMLQEQYSDVLEAARLAKDLDDPLMAQWASTAIHIEANRAGDFEIARRALEDQVDIAKRLQQPALIWRATYTRAAQALLNGHTALAEQLAGSALQTGNSSGQPDAFTFYGTQMMRIRYQQGRMGELLPLIADLADKNPSIPTFQAALTSAHLEAGNEESAAQLVRQAAAGGFSLPLDTAWLDGILNYTQVVVELGLEEAAEQLFDLLAPYEDQVPYQGLLPHEPLAMFLGALAAILGRYDQSDAYFEAAAELNARGEMGFAEARTQLLRARALISRDRPSDTDGALARTLFEQAKLNAVSRGYGMVERRAAIELANLS